MRETACDVLIVGGGTGGVAAALAAAAFGRSVILTEETDWIGGQLTAQAVPPDEHPWIETIGCTARYRQYRNGVRAAYCERGELRSEVTADSWFNPGGGWVSNLCHLPAIGEAVLRRMLQPAVTAGNLEVRRHTAVVGGVLLSTMEVAPGDAQPQMEGDRVRTVPLVDLTTGEVTAVHARYVIDATELGDLLALTGIEYVTGSEGRAQTGEAHAPEGPARNDNQQGFTWVFAMAHDEGSHRVIDRPAGYDRWRAFRPPFWPNPWLALEDVNPITLEPRAMPLFSDDWRCWFKYRQIVAPNLMKDEGAHPVTIVNWPQNDYFLAPITDVPRETLQERLEDSRQLSLSLLYWLQTECPRPDGGTGYPGLYLRPDVTGTRDGFAKTPYIRESRRLVARTTIREEAVSAAANPDSSVAPVVEDSVGIGAYRIDLHPSTEGDHYIDLASLPFQIPLGSLIPVRTRNLLAAGKNLGTTHVTNGCYRLHPVEWNIGEAAGALAAFCLMRDVEPAQVHETPELLADFQHLLRSQGVELDWPRLRAL